ncbi:MAG TPA: hypothetical protein EYG86_08430 [Crocinitomicaceae bacterium]|nr:hypothetical protein [Crocinitomicaceae bacterium]
MLKLIGITFVLFSLTSFGQLSNKSLKLEGTWEFKKGSGFETWRIQGNKLVGFEYRINKTGDTLKVERMTIRQVGGNMIYSVGEHLNEEDSTLHHENINFKGTSKNMNFINMDDNTPYSIEYKFGFFSKNRLKVKIKYGQAEKPVKLSLIRVKED